MGIENEMNAVAVDRPQGHMITNRIDDAQATTHSWTTNNRHVNSRPWLLALSVIIL